MAESPAPEGPITPITVTQQGHPQVTPLAPPLGSCGQRVINSMDVAVGLCVTPLLPWKPALRL